MGINTIEWVFAFFPTVEFIAELSETHSSFNTQVINNANKSWVNLHSTDP